MHIPKGCRLRPINTGWFASFSTLEDQNGSKKQTVQYGNDAFRFWGATFDPSGVYRLRATLNWLKSESISIKTIHEYVQELQAYFLTKIEPISYLSKESLLAYDLQQHGHFLTFNHQKAGEISKALMDNQIVTDSRGECLRFGFGIYQSKTDIDQLFERLV